MSRLDLVTFWFSVGCRCAIGIVTKWCDFPPCDVTFLHLAFPLGGVTFLRVMWLKPGASRFDQRDFDLFILNFLGLARFGPSFQAKSCALTRPAFYHTIGGVGHGFHQHEVDLWVWSGLQIWSVTEIVWHILRSDERYLLTHVGCLCHVSLLDDVRCHLGQNPRPVWAHCSDSSPCFERFISHGYLWSKNSWKFNAVFLI